MATTKKATTTKKPAAKTATKTTVKSSAAKASAAKKSTTQTTTKAKTTAEAQSKPRVRQPKVVTGFIDFLREQSVVGLAIGLVIGTQTKALADQLIASFINPLIGLVLPGRGALDQKVFALHLNGKTADFAWGSFAATLLSFLTTATVVYVVFKMLKLDRLTKKKEDK